MLNQVVRKGLVPHVFGKVMAIAPFRARCGQLDSAHMGVEPIIRVYISFRARLTVILDDGTARQLF